MTGNIEDGEGEVEKKKNIRKRKKNIGNGKIFLKEKQREKRREIGRKSSLAQQNNLI